MAVATQEVQRHGPVPWSRTWARVLRPNADARGRGRRGDHGVLLWRPGLRSRLRRGRAARPRTDHDGRWHLHPPDGGRRGGPETIRRAQDLRRPGSRWTLRGVPGSERRRGLPPKSQPWGLREFAVRATSGHVLRYGSEIIQPSAD